MPQCIGIRFDNGPKIHYVEAPHLVPPVGRPCVVSTRRGLEVTTIKTAVTPYERPIGYFVRSADEEDIKQHDRLEDKGEDLKWMMRARVRQVGLEVKIVRVEFNLNETVLVVHYSTDKMTNLRPFIRDLARYTRARIEFHNVGPRDQARMLGTLGACGTGSCSSTWLQSFSAVGIRMARDQQLPLNPEKISGPCGRLMCCLQYEHDMYRQLMRRLPRKNTKVCHTSGRCGRVQKLNPLKQSVDVATEKGLEEFPVEELEVVRVLPQESQQRAARVDFEDDNFGNDRPSAHDVDLLDTLEEVDELELLTDAPLPLTSARDPDELDFDEDDLN